MGVSTVRPQDCGRKSVPLPALLSPSVVSRPCGVHSLGSPGAWPTDPPTRLVPRRESDDSTMLRSFAAGHAAHPAGRRCVHSELPTRYDRRRLEASPGASRSRISRLAPWLMVSSFSSPQLSGAAQDFRRSCETWCARPIPLTHDAPHLARHLSAAPGPDTACTDCPERA